MPRFSVIITVYNRPGLVRQAIDSACAQTFADREIIVVDDSSTDDTPAVLRSYGDRIRVVTLASNQGCEVAYREGAAAAQGSYLAFLDSDDLLFPWALETYDFVIAATSEPALLVSRLAYFSTTPPVLPAPQVGDTFEWVVFKDYLSRDRTMGSSLSMIVVRTDVYVRSGVFPRSTATTFNMSDHNFLLRVGCEGPAVLLEHPRTVAYRNHAENSVKKLPRVADGLMRLVRTERSGSFPGGQARRFDRRASIGGPVAHFSRQALSQGLPGQAGRLFFGAFDMILAKLLKKLGTTVRGQKPVVRVKWQPRHPSPPGRNRRQ
jgi:glycosyltransferase involved in cell wall biosynthesis